MSALVLKKWRCDTKPIDDRHNYVSVTGRASGFVAWLLSLVGIDPTTTIVVGVERIEFSSASLAGTASRLIPLQGVCSSYYGYHKPWKAAASIIATFLVIGSSLGSGTGDRPASPLAFLVVSGIGLAIAFVYYMLNRTLTLGFVENSGVVSGIQFKRSVIENVDINQEEAKRVCYTVQRLIEAKERRLREQTGRQGDPTL